MATVAPATVHQHVEMAEVSLNGEQKEVETLVQPFSTESAEEPSRDATATINPAFQADETKEESPPLTYIDFLPQCFGVRVEGSNPTFAEYQSLVEQANQWLRSMPQFSAVKCETVDHKLNPNDFSFDPDVCLQHVSSQGKNIYIKALRLWLMPKTDTSIPVQQLGYITVLPDIASGSLKESLSHVLPGALRIHPEQLCHQVDSVVTMMEKLNHHLQKKPLPGRILTVETVPYKAVESDSVEDDLNTENTLWTEIGRNCRLFLLAVRVFYVVGQPAFEKIGYYDQVPDFSQNPEGLGLRVKFAPYSQTVSRAALWLKDQHGTKVVNVQSVTLKMERQGGSGLYKVNSLATSYAEAPSLMESRYIKILRLFYTKEKKADTVGLYGSTQMTTRLFVPTKTVAWGKSFETFSKTMQRTIAWLSATGTPVLSMETVKYQVSPENSEGAGVNDERVDTVINSNSGQYHLTCIRLYFARQFKEPPPEVMSQTDEDSWASWGCVLS